MKTERILKYWAEMYPEEMADMLKPLNEYFNTLLYPQTFENNYKIFWDYLINTQWNRVVLNPMHYIESEDIAEINSMTEQIRNQLMSNMDSLQNKHAYLNKLRESPFFISYNYDIIKEGSETIDNHSFTSNANSESGGSTTNTVTAYQNKRMKSATTHTYDAQEVDTEKSEEHVEDYDSNPAKPAASTDTTYNTRSITTHSRDGVHEYGVKGGKTFAENYKDIMDAMSYNYIEDICKVIMKGFMYYIYA